MTDLTDDKVKALLDGATPGRRVQFHGSYCPEAVGTPFTDWDTSHDVSVIRPDGSRYRLAHYKHASDAYLSQMAPDLARALLDARAELARVKADAAAAQELVIINLESDLLDRVLEGSVWSMPEGTHTTDEWGRGVTDARRDIAAAVRATFADIADNDGLAMVSEPHDPGDGWTWNERLGWIGPDGKPADPRRRG